MLKSFVIQAAIILWQPVTWKLGHFGLAGWGRSRRVLLSCCVYKFTAGVVIKETWSDETGSLSFSMAAFVCYRQ